MAWGKTNTEAFWIEEIGALHGYPSTRGAKRKGKARKKGRKEPHRIAEVAIRPLAPHERGPAPAEQDELRQLQDKMLKAQEELHQYWEKRAGRVRAQLGCAGPPTPSEVFYTRALEADEDAYGHPLAARVFLRTRTGFRYEREVRLKDFVTQEEAAHLLSVSVVAVNKWIRAGKLRNKKLRGTVVMRLRDVLAIARRRGESVPFTSRRAGVVGTLARRYPAMPTTFAK